VDKEQQGFPYGGQAVIEGVMIRGRSAMAVACRRKDGTIVTETRPLAAMLTKHRWLNLPFIRGTFALWDSLAIGFGSLLWSANLALEDEGEKTISRRAFAWTVIGAMLLGVAIFVVLPSLLTPKIGHSGLVSNLAEGGLRKVIFVLYVVFIMRLPDVQRLFAYHGAEHKVVNAYEHGDANLQVQAYSRIHRRCGTTFLAVVVIVGIVVYSSIGWPAWYWRVVSRPALLPVIAGISYEIIKLAARYDNVFLRALIWPGLLIQRLTTREPSPDMIEVAHAALKAVRAAEEGA